MSQEASSSQADVSSTVAALYDYVVGELLYDDEVDELTPDDELLGSGLLDSMAAVQLMQHVESTYAIEFQPQDLTFDNFNTLAALAALIAQRAG